MASPRHGRRGGTGCTDGGNESVSDGHSDDDGGSDRNFGSESNVGNDSNGVSDSDNGRVGGSNGNDSDGCDSDANCSSSRRLRQRFAFPVQASVK